MQNAFTVAVTGPDRWLRPKLIRRLTEAGLTVRDFGTGTSSIRGADALVYLPILMPTARPGRDTGTSAAGITFAAAAEVKVNRVVVVSRVGADRQCLYLDALRTVEANAARVCANVTVVRTAHPIGDTHDAGPVAETLRRYITHGDRSHDPVVEPVVVADLLDVIEAAIDGRIGVGVVEIGGPTRMPLSSLRALVGGTRPHLIEGRRPVRWMRPSRRRASHGPHDLLALESVANPRFVSPLGAAVRDLHTTWAVDS